MIDFGIAVSWMILSPIGLITDIIAIVIIAHYFPFFHGTDVTLISILTAMAGNAIFVLPIPAYLEIAGQSWNPSLCIGYVWCVLTFRLSQILSLMVISIHWSTLLKMSAQKKKYFSTKFLKITIVFIWICSAIFGLLPLIGVAEDSFNEKNTCKFLAFNLGGGYGLFFLILIITAMFVSVLCASDAMILIKHMKVVAKTKYQAGRFHIPDRRADLPLHGNSSLAERYHRLQFAWDLSKFALVFVILSFSINQLPYAVMQGIQTFAKVDRSVLEIVSIYMVGIEALLLPHTLWFLSRRYRHALTYQWQVHVLRNKDKEEDEPYSCTLQSYTQRERDRASVVPSRPSSIGRAGGISATGTMRSNKSDTVQRDQLHINGRTQIQTVFNEDGRATSPYSQDARVNGVIRGEVHVERPPSIYDERPVDIEDLEIRQKQDIVINESKLRRTSGESNSNAANAKQGPSFAQRNDVARSSSGKPKKDLKELMRKKHLPPIFVNEGFEVGDKSPTVEADAIKTVGKSGPATSISNSLHFYMSSDYHPDYLTESLPRNRINQGPSTESETGDAYTNEDIDEVLDDDSITDIQVVKARKAYVYNTESNDNTFSTFKNDQNEAKMSGDSSKSVYSTFEDLSQMYLRDEKEIEYDADTIPLDDINDRYISTEATLQYLSNVSTPTYGAHASNYTSFKPSTNDTRTYEKTNEGPLRLSDLNIRGIPFASRQDVHFESTSFGATLKRKDSGNSSWLGTTIPTMKHTQLSTNRLDTHNFKISSDNKHLNSTMFNVSSKYDTQINDKSYISDTDTQISFGDSTGFSVSGIDNNSIKTEQNVESMVQKQDNSIDDENASSGSNSSVTVSPYKGEVRRRPWMDDFDLQSEENSEIREPLVQDSDTDTLRDSHESSELRYGFTYDPRFAGSTHSELSTPVSSIFDEETDRGFEEALEQHINTGANVYSGVGLCFESIKEEPEDLTSSGSNPFLETISNGDEEFRTRAVVSRSSNSRTSSSTSISDNQLTNSPGRAQTPDNVSVRKPTGIIYKAPVIITTYAETDFGDSGFTSGLEKGNMSDSSGHQEFTPHGRSSPWPDDEEKGNLDMSFESNFCENENTADTSYTHTNSKYNDGEFTKGVRQSSFKKDEVRKPIHRALESVRSEKRPQPVRVKSLERTSPASARKLPKRGHSFEGPRTDVKPAFF